MHDGLWAGLHQTDPDCAAGSLVVNRIMACLENACAGMGVPAAFIRSFIRRLAIRRSGALQQTIYGSPPGCPVLGFPHHLTEGPAKCRSSMT